jgi:hypothetical protein
MDAFKSLFTEVYQKCFGEDLTAQLTESAARQLASSIFDKTGLVLGWKSLKNFSVFILNHSEKEEKPSEASLDTLARYIAGATRTDEVNRKGEKNPFRYWHAYQQNYIRSQFRKKRNQYTLITLVILMVCIGLFFVFQKEEESEQTYFEPFDQISAEELNRQGWQIQNLSEHYWSKRDNIPGNLTLFTLSGDNFVSGKPLKNLLLRQIGSTCFSTDIQLEEFLPTRNWQQAGFIFLEDSTNLQKCLRVTISYNDFFGGYDKEPEIFIQILSQTGAPGSKPVELVHHVIFTNVKENLKLIEQNTQEISLRVEMKDGWFRVHYGAGAQAVFALQEVLNKQVDFKPKFVGLFATCGENTEDYIMPVRFNSFSINHLECK